MTVIYGLQRSCLFIRSGLEKCNYMSGPKVDNHLSKCLFHFNADKKVIKPLCSDYYRTSNIICKEYLKLLAV